MFPSLYFLAVHAIRRAQVRKEGASLKGMLRQTLTRFRLVLILMTGVAVAAVLLATGVGQAREETTVSKDGSVSVRSVIPDEPDGEPVRHLIPLRDGVRVKPILSTGDIVSDPFGTRNEYQMSGIPDGLGAYKNASGMLKLFMNHELDSTPPDSPANVGARVSWLTIDPATLSVKRASYPLTGQEGFLRFCSATLRHINGTPMYFTGEETTDEGALTGDTTDGLGRGGSSIALNADTGEHRETRHFGLLPHENVVPIKGLARADFITTEDGDAPIVGDPDADPEVNESQLYSYLAPTFGGAISGNQGSLYAWKANAGQGQDNDPSTDDIKQGEALSGHFVRIPQRYNSDAAELEATAQRMDTFDFIRLEDAAVSKTRPNVLYITDTGSNPVGTPGSETRHGRLYKLTINKDDPRNATLRLLLDGDADNGAPRMTNPDNLDTSENSAVIQEDRNSEYRQADDPGNGYGRVLVYNLESKGLRSVARVNTPANLEPGTWESSGVINAHNLLGDDQWLLDVQAHSLPEEQPGPSLTPDSGMGEDGQLLRIKIPNT